LHILSHGTNLNQNPNRKAAGFTQQRLADSLEREQSFIWRIEHGERRLDVLEFFWVCEALGQDAEAVYSELLEAFHKIGS
jgi:transcriptional regulator with XRE-family HTH domain